MPNKLDSGSLCCCSEMTFSVFGERMISPEVNRGMIPAHFVGVGNLGDKKSPCQLLASVWYDETLRLNTSLEAGQYTLEDTLEDSEGMWDRQDPKYEKAAVNVRYTVAPWLGQTLYVITKEGSVQKLDLPANTASWWLDCTVDELKDMDGNFYGAVDSDKNSPGPPHTFHYPDGLSSQGVIGGQPMFTEDAVPIGGGETITGESSGWPFGKATRTQRPEGPDTLPGYNDTSFGALCEDGFTESGFKNRIAFVEVDEDGDVTKKVSGVHNIVTASDGPVKAREIRERDFLYTVDFSTPTKVLPLAVAANKWPYGIGAFVETRVAPEGRTVEEFKEDVWEDVELWVGWRLLAPDDLLYGNDWNSAALNNVPEGDGYRDGFESHFYSGAFRPGSVQDRDPLVVQQPPEDEHFTLFASGGESVHDPGVVFPEEYLDDGYWPPPWGAVTLSSGIAIGTPTSNLSYWGAWSIGWELGWYKLQYRVRYCVGEIKTSEPHTGELPYIQTAGDNIVYSTDWVDYYAGAGNTNTLSWGRLGYVDWHNDGRPAKIELEDDLDPINRYRPQEPEGTPASPVWKDFPQLSGLPRLDSAPGNTFAPLGASHEFVGVVRYFNVTENGKGVFYIDYEKADAGNQPPSFDFGTDDAGNPHADQDAQYAYRDTKFDTPWKSIPKVTPPTEIWNRHSRLVIGNEVVWDTDVADEEKTALVCVEVLTGNHVAVITKGNGEPQKLTVYGGVPWSITSSTPDANVKGRIISCSDRWIYVSMFPLQVKTLDGVGDPFVDGAVGCARNLDIPTKDRTLHFHPTKRNFGIPEHSWSSWLISLDGSITVPARVDVPDNVWPLANIWYDDDAVAGYLEPPPGPVASWTVMGNSGSWSRRRREHIKWDSPRNSGVIDLVSPGTMDPAEFF